MRERPIEPELLLQALEASEDGILILGPDRRVRHANRAYRDLWGFSEAFLARRPTLDECIRAACRAGLYALDDPEAFIRRRVEQLARRSPDTRIETPRTDGRVVEGRAAPLPDGGWALTFRDVTTRVRQHERLLRGQAFYKTFLERTHAVPWELDLEADRFVYMGDQIRALAGYPPEEWTDLASWAGRIHPEDRERTVQACMTASRTAQPHELRYRLITARGEVRWILDVVTPMRMPLSGIRLLGIFIDITAEHEREKRLREAEEAVRRLERLETVGLVASGVAHDFNNLLVPIVAYAEIVRERLPEASPLRPKLERIENAATQAAVLAQQVLAMCRDLGADSPAPVDVARAIREAEELLRTAVSRGVELAVHTGGGGQIRARLDGPRLQQVLLNLCVNAAQVMEGNGRIDIRVDRAGSAARIRVEDTGPGVPKELQKKIFEPFFTTRRDRGGTGIGLATVRRIVEDEWHGKVRVSNRPNGGAVFELLLPLCEELPAEETGIPAQAPTPPPKTEPGIPLLVVGDKQGLVEILTRVLAENGFVPTAAHTNADVEALLRRAERRPALLVADCNPPDCVGAAAARVAREQMPHLPVLLLVYPGARCAAEPLPGHGPVRSLEKPVGAQELSEALQELAGG